MNTQYGGGGGGLEGRDSRYPRADENCGGSPQTKTSPPFDSVSCHNTWAVQTLIPFLKANFGSFTLYSVSHVLVDLFFSFIFDY